MKKKLIILLCVLFTNMDAQELSQKDSWGIEVNPIRLLLMNSNYVAFSGTISHFDNINGIEIAIPIYYSREDNRFSNEYDNKAYGAIETRLNIDLHYRRYLSFSRAQTNSIYVGAFGRYTYLDGESNTGDGSERVNKLGFGGEVGMRVKNIFDTPFYWGASLMVGGYVTGNNDRLRRDVMFDAGFDDRQLIIDIELLKVGYEF